MSRMRINTEKFMEFIKGEIASEKHMEAKAKRDSEYTAAIEHRANVNYLECMLLGMTGAEGTDILPFMEEVEE